jgi:glucosylceramidase
MQDAINKQRRNLMKAVGAVTALGSMTGVAKAATVPDGGAIQWVSTTESTPWTKRTDVSVTPFAQHDETDAMVLEDTRFQTMKGFGACFSEISWASLSALAPDTRDAVMRELFAPGVGLNLSVCRTPVGANDYATGWYSYNEHAGDFTMSRFDLGRDDRSLVPFIRAAQALRPDLKIWASPWSPPTWMKRNKHYALNSPPPGWPDNGITPAQVETSGRDVFILEDRYLRAYALYFRKYVEGYRDRGIRLEMVMPQNEFNSVQIFPSCTWTPAGLARFIPVLGEQMSKVGVDIFFGTLERPSVAMLDQVMNDPAARKFVKGVGVQWAGRAAAPLIHHDYPDLQIYQSEQECGDGRNDWRYARYTWSLMKDYLRAGASVYSYWNIATPPGGMSAWGWKQNALLTVDPKTGSHGFTHDYHLFKHLSHFVQPGAVRIETRSYSGYDNMLAFKNPDGKIVVIVQNDMRQDMPIRIGVRDRIVALSLPADSFNTLVI